MYSGKIPRAFFLRTDVVKISRALLGQWLLTRIGAGSVTAGLIVETEAYAGPDDRASHAFGNRRTRRTEVMFQRGGIAYVYQCYGLHYMFNIITNLAPIPHAILIRAVEPRLGIAVMLKRRCKPCLDYSIAAGPGAVTQALGITRRQNGVSLAGNVVWLEWGNPVPASRIIAGPRVGIDYAGSDARRPWRFRIRHNPWTSRA